MYHFIVKQKLRRAFADIDARRYEQIVPQFAAEHRHLMYGNHALGGERHTIKATAAWYALHTIRRQRRQQSGCTRVRPRVGRVTSLEVHCDTAKLAGYCETMAAQGLSEAIAALIPDV